MLPCSDGAENARFLNALAVGLLPIDARVNLSVTVASRPGGGVVRAVFAF